jgi:hypothetical protein
MSNETEPWESTPEAPTRPRMSRQMDGPIPTAVRYTFPNCPCIPQKTAVFDGAGTDSNIAKEKDYPSTLDRVRVPLTKFEQELRKLINSQSMENASNTPDLILAEYLSSCLNAFNLAVAQREKWYGRKVF